MVKKGFSERLTGMIGGHWCAFSSIGSGCPSVE
jgi:hypothetical protein